MRDDRQPRGLHGLSVGGGSRRILTPSRMPLRAAPLTHSSSQIGHQCSPRGGRSPHEDRQRSALHGPSAHALPGPYVNPRLWWPLLPSHHGEIERLACTRESFLSRPGRSVLAAAPYRSGSAPSGSGIPPWDPLSPIDHPRPFTAPPMVRAASSGAHTSPRALGWKRRAGTASSQGARAKIRRILPDPPDRQPLGCRV